MDLEAFFKMAQTLEGYHLSSGDIFWWSTIFLKKHKVVLGLVLYNEQLSDEAKIMAINLDTGEPIELELHKTCKVKGFKYDTR